MGQLYFISCDQGPLLLNSLPISSDELFIINNKNNKKKTPRLFRSLVLRIVNVHASQIIHLIYYYVLNIVSSARFELK